LELTVNINRATNSPKPIRIEVAIESSICTGTRLELAGPQEKN